MKRVVNRKKTNKSGINFTKLLIFGFLFFTIFITSYHYREAILYYFSFKTHKKQKTDKVAQARIFQILEKYSDKVMGIDVSQFQGKIDWKLVDSVESKFPIKYVLIRATAGNDKVDSRFNDNWEGSKKYHFIRGAYHYYRPNENSMEQAKLFIKTVKLQKGDFPPVLDIEKLPEEQSIDSLKVGLKRWLKLVDKHYNVKPIIYTSEKYYTDFLRDEFSDYTFWIANYNFFVESINDDWLFWQFTEKGQVDGIDEKVDINIYNGTPKMMEYLMISN